MPPTSRVPVIASNNKGPPIKAPDRPKTSRMECAPGRRASRVPYARRCAPWAMAEAAGEEDGGLVEDDQSGGPHAVQPHSRRAARYHGSPESPAMNSFHYGWVIVAFTV